MNGRSAVEAHDVCKKFDIKRTTRYGGLAKADVKQVLNGLSFEARKGEVLGIVGRNGSGKSTLLKVLSGIMRPDSGSVEIAGKIAGILELGMGFQHDLSGRENVHIKCGMYGLSEKEIDGFIDEIIEFSELGDQIDHPLRTYSSGMIAKLAFAVLIHIRCDILVVDEVLSIGDAGFNLKCKMVFDNMKKQGKTIIMASHNMATLELMCDRVMWIDEGKVEEIGEANSVCYHFQSDLTDSYDTVLKQAEMGDVLSQNRLGIMFRDGFCVNADVQEAIEWFSRAAGMGSIEAKVNLADLHMKNGDRDSAMRLYKEAADAGNPIASARISLASGRYEAKVARLITRIREEAESGNTRSMNLLADLLFNGTLVQKDQKEALQWYEKCADAGIVACQFKVGLCYRDGIGTEKDSEKAIAWLMRSADNGSLPATNELANTYLKGIGTDKDADAGIAWLERAADFGDQRAMLQLSNMYRDGNAVPKDPVKQEHWLTRHASQDLYRTEFAFGDILKAGYVGEKQRECVEWFEDAAINGFEPAAFTLGTMYRDGIIVIADSSKAFKYYSSMPDYLSSKCLFEVAMMYLKGNGVVRDEDEAFNLMKKSADMQNNWAKNQLLSLKDQKSDKKNVTNREAIRNYLIEYAHPNIKSI